MFRFPLTPRFGAALGLSLALGMMPVVAAVPFGVDEEAPFLLENQDAMGRMMAGMAVQPSGNVDRDFALMMIAHHQGAIDMAKAELRYGRNEQLRRLAQGIVVEQDSEIAMMTLTLTLDVAAPSTRMNVMIMHKEP